MQHLMRVLTKSRLLVVLPVRYKQPNPTTLQTATTMLIDASFPPILFLAFHVVAVGLIVQPFPEKYRAPLLVFGAVQAMVEHYADVFPKVAALGPLLIVIGLGLIGYHYYLANQLIQDKMLVYGGFAGYLIVLVLSKVFDLGFPKDTAAEQIEALKDDNYVFYHFFLHLALFATLAPTALFIPTTATADVKKKAA